MQRRPLGRTGHESTVVAFGSAALYSGTESMAKEATELALAHGLNHFDVAPSYGRAEELLGPMIPSFREKILLACKTLKRDKKGAAEELQRSLKVLNTDHFDLYQVHGINSMDEVNQVLGKDGAIEAFLQAKQEGTIRHVGITGHDMVPVAEALRRFDFDTVMFPLNFVMSAHQRPENDFRPMLALAEEKGIGAIAIKAVAKGRWESREHAYRTWYEPLDDQREIDLALWFTLSHPVATAVLPSELSLWPRVIDAAERVRDLTDSELRALREKAELLRPLFPEATG